MKQRLAFFDVDSREQAGDGSALVVRPRMAPLARELELLYAGAAAHGSPLVFTTCCSGRMPAPGGVPGMLFVPLDPARGEWEAGVAAHRLFYLEKITRCDPAANYACRAYDVFATNGNAARLARALAPDEWIVFGNGFDLCVNGVVRGLLGAGQRVCLLPDVTCPSAAGYGDFGETGTPQNRRRLLAELAALGVRMSTREACLAGCAP